MIDLTVLILTKDEEENLPKCIASIGDLASRIVIVDSGSTDKTLAIARRLSEKAEAKGITIDIYSHEWEGFSAQLNWGFAHTDIRTEWIMRMDADEELTGKLREEIRERLPRMGEDVNGIILRRRVYFLGKWLKHGGKYPELLLRIIRRGKGKCEERRMDEHLVITEGRTETFRFDFADRNTKNLSWWTGKHNGYSELETEDFFRREIPAEEGKLSAQAKRKRRIKFGGYYRLPKFLRAHLYFIYRYYFRLGFLDGKEGKIYTFLQAYWYRFLVDAKIYEKEKKGLRKDRWNG